jgi:hypothetical protein
MGNPCGGTQCLPDNAKPSLACPVWRLVNCMAVEKNCCNIQPA